MQQTTKDLHKTAKMTILPEDVLRRVEKLYTRIHEDTDYGSIKIKIARGEVCESEYSVTEIS